MKRLFLLIMFFLLLTPIYAEVITIGISPSEFKLYGEGEATLNIKFYNTYGEVDAYYTVRADECMFPYVVSGFETDVLVPMGTNINNPVIHELILNGNFSENKNCFVYVHGRPVDAEDQTGNVNIDRRLGVRIIMGVKPITTTTTSTTTTTTTVPTSTTTTTQLITTTTQSSGGLSGIITTTTTIKDPMDIIPDNLLNINYPSLDNVNKQPIVEQINQEEKQEQQTTPQSTGLAHFFLNTTTGFFTLVGVVAISILVVVFLIQRGKRNPNNDLLFQENQGIITSCFSIII